MDSHIGVPIELNMNISTMKRYDPDNPERNEKLKPKARNQLTAYIYTVNADKSKCGSLETGLQNQMSHGNNQYAKNIEEANNVLRKIYDFHHEFN
jgi:hypothetical protein